MQSMFTGGNTEKPSLDATHACKYLTFFIIEIESTDIEEEQGGGVAFD